jgi:hypothetical protein
LRTYARLLAYVSILIECDLPCGEMMSGSGIMQWMMQLYAATHVVTAGRNAPQEAHVALDNSAERIPPVCYNWVAASNRFPCLIN